MALVIKDRVKETTITTGTGTYTLAGAVSGFETFTANLSNSDTTYYVCTDNTDFEVGLGTFTSSGTTLSRDTILASSNSNNEVNWSSGTRSIFMTYPADKAVFKDASNNINGTFVGNITGNVTGNTSGTSGSTTGNAATATALETARTIGGVSFDGTGNINLPGVNTSGNQDTSGNAATATALETGRTINGTSFDGTGNITVTAAAGTLTGNTLNSGVTASSLTSVGTLSSVTTSGDVTVGDDLTVNGGVIDFKSNSGSPASLKLYCEVSNAHFQTLQPQPHAASASNTLRLPNSGSSDTQDLVAVDITQTLTNKTLTSPKINEDVAVTSTATELNILDGVTSSTAELNILDGVTSTTAELNILDGVTATASELNILDGKSFVDEDDMASDSATAIASQQSIKAYVDAQKADMQFVLEDGDGTEVQITKDKEVKFVEGGGLDINWTDTSTGSDGDPYDLTFTVNASQTGITSLVNTSLEIGRDADNRIKFGTDNQITFEVSGGDNVIFKASGEIEASSLDISGDADIDGTLEADAITVNGTALDTHIAGVTVTNATNATHVTVTDNESTSENNLITFVENAQTGTGNHGLEMDGNFTYNPSEGSVSASAFKPINGGQANAMFTNASGQLCFGMDGSASNIVFKLDDEDGQPIFTFSEEGGTAILDGGDTDVTSHKPFIANSTITVGDGDLVLGSTAVTSTAAELNILDGVTATASELNIMDGVTSTTAELNILDGVTATASELNIMDGVTATTAELNHSDGVTSNIQTQLDAKTTATAAANEATALAIALG